MDNLMEKEHILGEKVIIKEINMLEILSIIKKQDRVLALMQMEINM